MVHHLKLAEKEIAKFGDLNIFDKEIDEVKFNEKCDEYDINPTKSTILLEFIYDIHTDDSVLYREVKPFPEGGGYSLRI